MKIPLLKNTAMAIVLSQDMKKERIIIGEYQDIRNYFESQMKVDFILDTKRPIGQFIRDFVPHTEFLADMFIEVNGRKFSKLEMLYESKNPVYQYIALRVLQECNLPDYDYCFEFAQDLKYNLFEDILDGQKKDYDNPFIELHPFCSTTKPTELIFDLRNLQEVAVITYDLLPLAMWYMRKIYDRGYQLQECKICKKTFLAKAKNVEICNKKCKKENTRRNKAEFDGRAKTLDYEMAHKNEYAYWYNRLKKFPKDSAEYKAFNKFCDKAKALKKQVKKKEIPAKDFIDWLNSQRKVVYNMLAGEAPLSAKEKKKLQRYETLYNKLYEPYSKQYSKNKELFEEWLANANIFKQQYLDGDMDYEDLEFIMQMKTLIEDPKLIERRARL